MTKNKKNRQPQSLSGRTQSKQTDSLGPQEGSPPVGSGLGSDGVVNVQRGLPAPAVPRQHNVVPVAVVDSRGQGQGLRAGKVQGGAAGVDAHQVLGAGRRGVRAAAVTDMTQ